MHGAVSEMKAVTIMLNHISLQAWVLYYVFLHDIKICKNIVLVFDLETCKGTSCSCCGVFLSDLKTLLFLVVMFYYTI